MFTEHLVGGRHYSKHFTCIDLFNLHKMLRNRHYYYPCFMHGGAERLKKGHSDLDLCLHLEGMAVQVALWELEWSCRTFSLVAHGFMATFSGLCRFYDSWTLKNYVRLHI